MSNLTIKKLESWNLDKLKHFCWFEPDQTVNLIKFGIALPKVQCYPCADIKDIEEMQYQSHIQRFICYSCDFSSY